MLDLQEALDSYLHLVLEANKTTNVTSIRNYDDAKILHLEDSLTGLPYIQRAIEGPYVDLGTGGGFPGIPIAFATQRETTLVDSVGKKLALIENAVNQIDFPSNITYSHIRIEDLAIKQREKFAVATARALSSLSSLIELASPLLKNEGSLICYKAKLEDDELERAKQITDKLGFQVSNCDRFTLSDGTTERSIVVFKKVKNASIKLPRKVGMAQKQPLS